MTAAFIHPDRVVPRFRPLKAWSHMKNLLADKEDTEQVFHIIEALNGRAAERNFRQFIETEGGRAALEKREFLPPLLDDHGWIRELPEGTVGRAYISFMEREQLTAQGLVDESLTMKGEARKYDDDLQWYINRLRDTHDLFHVLSGYGRDALGEASLLAFSHGQNPGLGVIFISYVGSRELTKALPREARVMDCFHEGRKHGKAAAKIVEQDIMALLREPLDAARSRMNIAKPVAYQKALQVCADNGFVASEIKAAA